MSTALHRTWPVGLAALLGVLCSSTPSQPARAGADKPPAEERRSAVSALLHIARHPPGVLEGGKQEAADPAEPEEYRRLQAELVRSRLVLGAALRSPAVAKLAVIAAQKDPLTWLDGHLLAELLPGRGVLRVWVNGGTPQEQAALTNAVVHAYLDEVVNRERVQKTQRLDRLNELHQRYKLRLKTQRKVGQEVAEHFGAGAAELDVRKQLLLRELNSLQDERLRVRSELRRLRLQRAAVKDKAEAAVPQAEVEQILKKDAQVNKLLSKLAKEEVLLANLAERLVSPEKSASYEAVKDNLKETKKSLAARREHLRPAAVAQLQERQQAQLDEQIRLLEKLSDQLDKELKERTRDYGRLAREAHPLELQELREEIRETEEMRRKLGARIRALEVEIDAGPRVILLQEASAPK